MATQNYPFTKAEDYSYDAAVIEITGGVAKLKDRRPANATFHANFAATLGGNWGGGAPAGTAGGSAAVSGGALDMGDDAQSYVDWAGAGNADHAQAGAVRFTVTPGYTGAPSTDQHFFVACKADADDDNLLEIKHAATTGKLIVMFKADGGADIAEMDFGAWSPTAAASYELELNYDLTGGATRLFIGGVLHGTVQTDTGARGSTIALMRVGAPATVGSVTSDFDLDDLTIFDAVQHTAAYAPGAAIPPTIYDTDKPTVHATAAVPTDDLSALSTAVAVTGSDLVKYTVEVDGVEKYWDGDSWETSSGYAQSNSAAEIDANAASLLSAEAIIRIVAYLHSDDGSTTPQLNNLVVTYSEVDELDTCVVWGQCVDVHGAALSGVTVTAKAVFAASPTAIGVAGKTHIWADATTAVTSDANGIWQLELVPNAAMTPDTGHYQFTFRYDNRSWTGAKIVPNATNANYADLSDPA